MVKLTKAQQLALKRIHQQHIVDGRANPAPTYLQFRRTVQPEICSDAVLVRAPLMWIGIEADGYAHT